MKDCFLDTLFSLGQACVDGEETLTLPCIYIKTVFPICQPLNSIALYQVTLYSHIKKNLPLNKYSPKSG